MSSLPAASLRPLPPNEDSEDGTPSSRQALLSRSVPKQDYSSTSKGGGTLVAPVIGDDEVEIDLQRSRESLDKCRARTAVSALQDGEESTSDSGWFHIERRKDHLTT